MFEALLEARGVKEGRGGDRRSEEATKIEQIGLIAKEAGVHPDTARNCDKVDQGE